MRARPLRGAANYPSCGELFKHLGPGLPHLPRRSSVCAMTRDLEHVRNWIFDLDNTLYPPQARLFDQIETRMAAFVARELGLSQSDANALRRDYWSTYGTTLKGLMINHGVDPTAFLNEVHDISMAALVPDPQLASHIDALPGRKLVFTNGDRAYARKVLAARGLSDVLVEIYGVEEVRYIPKPEAAAYDHFLEQTQLDPATSAMFEDDPRNLHVPHERGMRTILVGPEHPALPHLHHQTSDLTGFLSRLLSQGFTSSAAAPDSIV